MSELGIRVGWITHLWKSVTRQDHGAWRYVLRGLIPETGLALDVGAHGGQFARLLAGVVPRGQVLAFEPSSYARSVLKPALRIRRVQNVKVYPLALGAERGSAVLRTPMKRRGEMGYGLAHLGDGDQHAEVTETIRVTTLDAFAESLPLARLDFIKADIEGFEAEMVAGGRRTIERFRPLMLLEMDPRHLARAGTTLAAFWDMLTTMGYKPSLLAENSVTPVSDPTGGDILWRWKRA
jgi:FkbM family methyltransferase